MQPNEELMRKAEIKTDALASQGKLNDKQADAFIDFVVDQTGLKDVARVVKFRNENMIIDKITVADRVAMPATEATAPTGRRGVTTSKVQLTPKEIIVPFEISTSFLEINLEGEVATEHIIKMMATRLANNLELLYLTGDSTGPSIVEADYVEGGHATDHVLDSYLALFNGWLRDADSGNVVNAAGASISSNIFNSMINAHPDKFKRDMGNLRLITSPTLEQNYRMKYSTRATQGGEDAAQSQKAMTPFGVPLVKFPLFPATPKVVEHVTLPGTTAVALRYAPVDSASEAVLPTTLGATATTPFVEGVDYDMDYTNGTIARNGGGSIGDGDTVKITYTCYPWVLLTHYQNLILAIGRDITIEKDRDIFKRMNQYAITCKVDVQIEEATAITKAKNVARTVT